MILKMCDVCHMPIKNIEPEEPPQEILTPFGLLRKVTEEGEAWKKPKEKPKEWQLELQMNIHICENCRAQVLGLIEQWVICRRAEVEHLKFKGE